MRTLIRHSLMTALAVLVSASLLSAQTVVTSTTLTSPILNNSDQTINLTSATGVAGQTIGVQTYLYIDREAFQVVSVTGLVVRAIRGVLSTKGAPHLNGSTVWVGPPGAFKNATAAGSIPTGQCLRTSLLFVPIILVGGDANGRLYDCMGVTSAGQYVLVSEPGPAANILGSTVASAAGVITATGTVFTVSGTAAITGITLPAGWGVGMSLYITPSGVFTWTAATNIALAGTAVVNKLLMMTWNGTKWVPSYIA